MAVTLISFTFFLGIAISRVGLPPIVGFLLVGFGYNFMGFQASGLDCKVHTIAKHETGVEELNKMGVPSLPFTSRQEKV